MTTDTSEHGLERHICITLTGQPCDPPSSKGETSELSASYGGAGWTCAGHGALYQRSAVATFELKNNLTRQTVDDAVSLTALLVANRIVPHESVDI